MLGVLYTLYVPLGTKEGVGYEAVSQNTSEKRTSNY